MAVERARLVSGYAHAGGDAGPASWPTREWEVGGLGWAKLLPLLSFLFYFFCFDSNLVRV